MEIQEKLVRGRLDSIRTIYHTTDGDYRKELDEEITFLERLLRYCGKDLFVPKQEVNKELV